MCQTTVYVLIKVSVLSVLGVHTYYVIIEKVPLIDIKSFSCKIADFWYFIECEFYLSILTEWVDCC